MPAKEKTTTSHTRYRSHIRYKGYECAEYPPAADGLQAADQRVRLRPMPAGPQDAQGKRGEVKRSHLRRK